MSSDKFILVYGGSGALGNACVTFFTEHGYKVINVDLFENKAAYKNVLVARGDSIRWSEQDGLIHEQLSEILDTSIKLDAIICVAGGWAGGNAADKEMVTHAELMWKQSVWSSTIAASLAPKYLSPKGTLILTGAVAAYDGPTPGMIGYGMAKAAVIQLTRSLGAKGSGLPEDAFVCCIMPETLDTPTNRMYMPKSDFTKWTPLEEVTKKIHEWILNENERPTSGCLVKIITRDQITNFEVVA